MAQCVKLHGINIRQNGISALGAPLLGNLVQRCATLLTLDLPKNVRPVCAKGKARPRLGRAWREELGVGLLLQSFPTCVCAVHPHPTLAARSLLAGSVEHARALGSGPRLDVAG